MLQRHTEHTTCWHHRYNNDSKRVKVALLLRNPCCVQFIQGLSQLDFRRDPYLQRKLREIVVHHLPRFQRVVSIKAIKTSKIDDDDDDDTCKNNHVAVIIIVFDVSYEFLECFHLLYYWKFLVIVTEILLYNYMVVDFSCFGGFSFFSSSNCG